MTQTRPRLLLVKPIVPYPPDQGTKIVSFELIRALRESFDITVLARMLGDDDVRAASELEPWCDRVVTVLAPSKRSMLHRVGYKLWYSVVSVATRRSLKRLYDCPGVLKRAARTLAAEGFDVVVIEYWQMYPLFDVFPRESVVLLTHDIDLLVNRQCALLERRVWRKLVKVWRWMLEKREEVGAYGRAQRILALTERDAHAVRTLSHGRATVGVLPFGVDPERFRPPANAARQREILFMGVLGAAFNSDALDYFAHAIYPLLDGVGEFTLTIVGGDLPGQLDFLRSDPRVAVVGRVADVRPYLHRAACIVVPLRFGGGLRIRTLEAMMAGLPVVCTTVAIAGMDFEPGRDYLLADTPEEFADRINRVLNDPDLGPRVAANARARVVANYASPGQAERTRVLFESFVR